MMAGKTTEKMPRVKVDPLAHKCERCQSNPGVPCRNYMGKPKAACVERGRPDITARKEAKKASELTARAEATYGPLFAHLMPEAERVTVEDVKARKLRALRAAVEWNASLCDPANELIEWVRLYAMRRAAAEALGGETEAKLWEYVGRVHPRLKGAETYIAGYYRTALTTAERIEVRMGLEFDPARVTKYNRDGRRVVCVEAIGAEGRPVMTREEFEERFRVDHLHGDRDAPESDTSDEVFELAMARLAEGCRAAAGVAG